jgi:transposase-like protein
MRNHGRTTGTNADSFRRVEVITGIGRRRRWTDEEKARIVAESLDPATTASAVARRYGLHASQLFTWRQQLHPRSTAVEGYEVEHDFPQLGRRIMRLDARKLTGDRPRSRVADVDQAHAGNAGYISEAASDLDMAYGKGESVSCYVTV